MRSADKDGATQAGLPWLVGAAFAVAALAFLTDPACAAEKEGTAAENLYLAPPQLSRSALGEFIESMREKPASIRARPGFYDAVIEAADRVLDTRATAELTKDDLYAKALLAKFWALDNLSRSTDAKAEAALGRLAKDFEKDPRPAIAAEARFHLLEKRVLAADTLEPADLPKLLAELKAYFSSAPLDNRDVRLASATVRVINRLADDDAAAAAYREFGGLFVKSKDPELARYGRKIVKGPAVKKSTKTQDVDGDEQ